MHLRRDFQAQAVQPDEAGGVVLIVGFGRAFAARSGFGHAGGSASIVAVLSSWFMRAESDAPQFYNRQPSRQPGQKLRLATNDCKAWLTCEAMASSGSSSTMMPHNCSADNCGCRQIKIAGDENQLMALRVGGDGRVINSIRQDVANVERFRGRAFAKAPQTSAAGSHRAGISSRGCERMVFFLINEFTGEFQRGADLGASQSVFAFHFFKAHAASKAADNQRNGHPRASNDRLTVADFRVNDDLVVHGFSLTLVEI